MTLWDLLKPLKDAMTGVKAKPVAPIAPARKPARAKLGPALPSAPAPTKQRPPARKRRVPPPGGAAEIPSPTPPPSMPAAPKRRPALSMDERYEAMVREMLAKYGVRVRKWRTSMSGIAWYVTYRDGHVQKLIESPKPKGPMSAAIFLHEIGHHAIGFNVYKPRCLEEYHAWQFSLREMERFGFNVTDSVKTRVYRSLRYAVAKAQRRGIREVPVELLEYVPGKRAG